MKTVIVKFKYGESILATLLKEDLLCITVRRPLMLRMIPSREEDGSFRENPSISVYCPFSAQEDYEFSKSDIIYCVDLFPKVGDYYLNLAEELYQLEITRVREKSIVEDTQIVEEEEDTTNMEDLHEILKNIKKQHFH